MTQYLYDDETGEQVPVDIDEAGNVALLEGDFEEEEGYTDEDLEELMIPIVVEAILEGKLPSTDVEFAHARELGLELGVVVNTTSGLALARDVESQGLELGYAANFDKIRGFGKSLHATGLRGGIKRTIARTKGRAATVGRGATDFANRAMGRLADAGTTASANAKQMYGAAKQSARTMGTVAGKHVYQNRGRLGAVAGLGVGLNIPHSNPLHADAERRSAKK